jgi:cytidylate kinase
MIIELIGLAGSGKSTLANALTKEKNNIRIETPPSYHKIKNLPFFVVNAFGLIPNLPNYVLDKNIKYSLWSHFISNILISGWHKELCRQALKSGSSLLLDQGPAYMMTFETLFGFAMNGSSIAQKFWERAYHCWANTLDILIWLDASTSILIDRIRSRETWHSIKDRDDIDAHNYIETYRQAYKSVVSRLIMYSPTLKIINLDTGELNLDESVKIILREIN